jgi:lysophospholipase L1-like esterase
MVRAKSTILWISLAFALALTVAAAWPRGDAQAASGVAAAILQKIAAERGEKTQPLEYASGEHPLDNFYAALTRTAMNQPGAITRIAHYGDSLTEMELVAAQARRRLQEKFGDCGHGFIHVSRPQPWYRPYDVTHEPSPEWVGYALWDTKLQDRRFGYGGGFSVVYRPKAKSVIGPSNKGKVGRAVSRFEIMVPFEPAGGPIRLAIDGKSVGVLNTQAAAPQDAYAEFRVPDGAHELEVVGENKGTRVYGVVLEREGPGVVYDALGVNGIGIGAYLTADRQTWVEQLRHRNPALVILGFGGNEARSNYSPERVKSDVKGIVAIVREALPNASILLVGPVDSAIKEGMSLVSHPALPKVIAKQREAAAEARVAYWSLFDAMGGAGSMVKWREASPPLGAGDLIHPTPKGGDLLGDMLYRALMQGFGEYLERAGQPGAAPPPPKSSMVKVSPK